MSTLTRLRLFEAFGVELEYMIVDRQSLRVLPITDRVLEAVAGRIVSDVELDTITWSNELVLHVIELKTTDPAPTLSGLSEQFQANVRHINRLLEPLGGRLMPTAMHPWMDPAQETQLWPHEYNAVYETFDRIFNCQGHGWSNLQSVHLNLPFGDGEEFGRLHAAIRLVLPILPALAASSPVVEGKLTGLLDNRMEFYRTNARRIPSICGLVVPEPIFSPEAYQTEILERIYRDLAPFDPEGILQDEFANARGAIARFERGSIEIRVLDIQECPAADLAICQTASAVLRRLVDERLCSLAQQQTMPTEPLSEIFLATIRDADRAVIRQADYLAQLGFPGKHCTAGELWQHLVETCGLLDETRGVALLARPAVCPTAEDNTAGQASSGTLAPWQRALQTILHDGPLARRIVGRLAGDTSPERLQTVYGELCACLDSGSMFSS